MNNQKSDILIILDIDETLIYACKQKLEWQEDFHMEDYFIYKRPYLNDFLDYIFSNYRSAIWSSATDKYVEEVVNWLGIREKLEFFWARSKATLKRPEIINEEGELNENWIDDKYFIKRLKKVKKLGFPLERMLIIDNTPRKSKENYGNAIYVSDFEGDQNDNELKLLIEYLETLKKEENLRLIEKRNWKNKA